LKQGVEAWNAWREENPDVRPDLNRADLRKVDLREANLSYASLHRVRLRRSYLNKADLKDAYLVSADLCLVNLNGSNLVGADLGGSNLWSAKLKLAELSSANLYGTILREVDFSEADLGRADLMEANLKGAKLYGADLSKADLSDANLNDAFLHEANFNGVNVRYTSFGNVDLRDVKGLKEVKHSGPSTLGLDTVQKSKGKIPEVFLRGCGLSDYEIEIVKLWRKGMDRNEFTNIAYDLVNLYCGDGLQFYSCFISYDNADEAFARKLHDDLQDNGVRCWFAPEDMKIGDRIRPRIDQEIRLRDKLLVILSENSVDSEWVGDEVEAALEDERMDGRTILFPIRVDNAVMETRLDWAAKIRRRRHIGDYTGWQDEVQYQQGFQRLLRDLKAMGSE
jgi:hypothetical protein